MMLTETRLSVAYSPPSPAYMPLQAIVQRTPNLRYQVYFEDPKSSLEVLRHVIPSSKLKLNVPDMTLAVKKILESCICFKAQPWVHACGVS